MSLLLVVLVFLVTVFLVILIGSVIINRRGQVDDRLANIKKMSADADPEDILRLPFFQRVIYPALNNLGHLVGNIAPREIRTRVENQIMYAGRPKNINFFTLLALQALWGGGFLLATYYVLQVMQVDTLRLVLITILAALVGFFFPYVLISKKAEARQETIRRALPDFLDLLLVSVEAGLGFDMALKRVSQQMPGPLSDEVRAALEEIRMGGSRERALRGIAIRCGVNELRSFISAVIQSEQLGSNIASTLRVQAEYMRMKRRQRAEEMAMKAPVKLIFPLVLFILPALFVVILGPAVIRIFGFFAGM